MSSEGAHFVVPDSGLAAIRVGAKKLSTEQTQQDTSGVLPAHRFTTAGGSRGQGGGWMNGDLLKVKLIYHTVTRSVGQGGWLT